MEDKLQPYLDSAKPLFEGDVIDEVTWPFSVEAMDASFHFSTTCVEAVKTFLASKAMKVDNIFILTAFQTRLNRVNTKFDSESLLRVVRNGDEINALLFLGCSIRR